MWGLQLYSLICTPDNWLEVSIQPERPATSNFDQSFSIFFLGPVENVELLCRLYVALHANHAALPTSTSEFPPERNLPNVIKSQSAVFQLQNSAQMLKFYHALQTPTFHFRLPLRSRWELGSSGLLRSEEW